MQIYQVSKCYLKLLMLKDDNKFHKTVKPEKGSLKKPSFLKLLLKHEWHKKPWERFPREGKGGASLFHHLLSKMNRQ